MAHYFDGDRFRRTKAGSRPRDKWGRFAKVYKGRAHPKIPRGFKLPQHERKRRQQAAGRETARKTKAKREAAERLERAAQRKTDRRRQGRFEGETEGPGGSFRLGWRLPARADETNLAQAVLSLGEEFRLIAGADADALVWVYVVGDYQDKGSVKRGAHIPTRAMLLSDLDIGQLFGDMQAIAGQYFAGSVSYHLLTFEEL